MTKIAFFLPSFRGGGAERVCLNLAETFLRYGLDVDFVLVEKTGPLLKDIPPETGVIDLSIRHTFAALLPLATYLRQEKPFALIAAPDHANLVAIWSKMLAASKTKVLIGNHIQLSISIKKSKKIQEKIYPFLLHLFYRQADALIAVSQGAADDMARVAGIPRDCILTIYNPCPFDKITRMGLESPAHPWLATRKPPVILAAGRLSAQKDYPTLLRAFAILYSRRPARLIILGDGKELNHLLALADELGIRTHVDLPGFMGNPYSFMAHCQVFVLSSVWEGFGNVLVEALACGTQIVSTDCPSGPAEILENGKYGRLVPVGDPEALANAIESALDHPLPVESLTERAKTFSSDVAGRAYLQVLGLSPHEH